MSVDSKALIRGLGSELLRYVSGYSVLGTLAFCILVPWFVANFLGWPDQAKSAQDVAIFWAISVSLVPVAAFAGSYVVTREAFYRTLRRSIVTCGATALVHSKCAAALIIGLLTGLVGLILWGLSVALAAAPGLAPLLVTAESVAGAPGVLLACVLGAAWGCSLGWIIQHYYATTILTLVVPVAVELPLLINNPDVGRWLPSGALAGVAGLPVEGLLDPFPSFFVSLAWLILAGGCALWFVRSREP